MRKVASACLLSSSLLFALGMGKLYGQASSEHPLIDTKDIKSDTCLKCHSNKNTGKFVHSAVGMGCENCHLAATENNQTTITLVATGGDLCAMCHEAKKDPVVHAPVKAGQCLICHDPHTGEFKAMLRAQVNTVCLSCHGEGQSNVRINAQTKLVTLVGRQVISLDQYNQATKIGLDPSGSTGHPIMGHPLTGKDPRQKDALLNCVSCHNPHSSALPKLLPAEIKNGLDLCAQCHK